MTARFQKISRYFLLDDTITKKTLKNREKLSLDSHETHKTILKKPLKTLKKQYKNLLKTRKKTKKLFRSAKILKLLSTQLQEKAGYSYWVTVKYYFFFKRDW
jgi:hypothetical protein